MSTTYQIRTLVIATADDDGGNAATITPVQITSRIQGVNQIYAFADIELLFDEQDDFVTVNSTLHNRDFTPLEPPNAPGGSWDHEPLLDRASHSRARSELAQQFPGRLVLIYRNRKKLSETGDGIFQIVSRGGGSSGWAGHYVNMSTASKANDLGHEIGHYLQIAHPFVEVDTVKDAAQKIQDYVDAGNPKDRGLDALDGDRDWVLDTPADATPAVFDDQSLPACGSVGEIPIPVPFPEGTKVYTLAPDRSLIMSYFKGCPGPKTISPQQARRIRDGLEMGLRHDLIAPTPTPMHDIFRGDTGTAGGIHEVDLAMVRAGRVVTAVRDGGGDLKVIVWDLHESGEKVARRGSAGAGAVGRIAVCGGGLDRVATAVIQASGALKVILWAVDEDGSVTRLESAAREGAVTDVAVCHLTRNHIATATREADGSLRLDAWYIPADGSVTHRASATAGKVNGTKSGWGTPRLALHPMGQNVVVAHVRDGEHDLKTIAWKFVGGKLSRVASSSLDGPPVGFLSACGTARELGVAAFQDAQKELRLVAHRYPADAEYLQRGGTAGEGGVAEVKICRVGTEMVVTAVRDSGNHLKLILWQVTRAGDQIVRRGDVSTEEDFFKLALCTADRDQVVTALADGFGNLKVIAWRVASRFSRSGP